MAAGVKYECFFTSQITGNEFKLVIIQDPFVGVKSEIKLSDISLKFNGENLLSPIRSTELNISVLGKSLEDFYCDSNYEFKAELYQITSDGVYSRNLIFSGFLEYSENQKSFNDIETDVNLTFICGLGTLQNIKLKDALYAQSFDIGDKLPLSSILLSCVKATRQFSNELNAYINIFSNLMLDRVGGSVHDAFECYIDTKIWDKETTAYQCIEDICSSFNGFIYLRNSQWTFIRPGELYLYNDGAVEGSRIFISGTRLAASVLSAPDVIGKDLYSLENDATQSIVRSFKSIKKTFTYTYPEVPIYNLDLKILGTFRTSYTSSGNTIKEYQAPGFFPNPLLSYPADLDYWIEVVVDSEGLESERYLVIKYLPGAASDAVFSSAYYINKDDIVNFSFEFRTKDSITSGSRTIIFNGIIDNPLAASDYKVNYRDAGGLADGTWELTGSIAFYYSPGQDSAEWSSVSVTSKAAPTNGYVKVALSQNDFSGGQTYWKALNVNLSAGNKNSTRILSQTHFVETALDRVQTVERTCVFDDTLRNIVNGTLLTNVRSTNSSITVGTPNFDYRTKTQYWHRRDFGETLRLNEFLCKEEFKLTGNPRNEIQGTFEAKKIYTLSDSFKFKVFGDEIYFPISIEHNVIRGTFNARLRSIGKYSEVVTSSYELNIDYE